MWWMGGTQANPSEGGRDYKSLLTNKHSKAPIQQLPVQSAPPHTLSQGEIVQNSFYNAADE